MFPLLLQVLPPICMLYKVAMILLPRLKNQKNKLSFEQWLPLHWLLTLPANFLLANLAGYNPRDPGIRKIHAKKASWKIVFPRYDWQFLQTGFRRQKKPSTLIEDILVYFAPKPNNLTFYCAFEEKYLKKSNSGSTSYQRISIKLNHKVSFLSFLKTIFGWWQTTYATTPWTPPHHHLWHATTPEAHTDTRTKGQFEDGAIHGLSSDGNRWCTGDVLGEKFT